MNSENLARARRSLDGLSVGDAFGERFFLITDPLMLIESRAVPRPPWRYTDDTEMALAIFSLLERSGRIDQDELAAAFGRRYTRDPRRGYGAGAHDILSSIAAGVPWSDVSRAAFGGSGSKGNGGAMRAAPIGAYFAGDHARAAVEARASAEVTHAHRDGQAGAIAIAVAASWAATQPRGEPQQMFDAVLAHTPEGPTREGIERACALLGERDFNSVVLELGNGSRVLSEDTVPFSLWSAARHLGSYEEAMWSTVSALGDRDTTCAIVGGILGAVLGPAAFPPAWLEAREPLPPLEAS